ncbi:protein disulfide-isomerase A4-like [Watersipora subatra]|uniref:protein disulfide-isomerase A4-like n=1 Tax=Watersipora subatra TaxID=2589382 RepID=UPI00355B3FAF
MLVVFTLALFLSGISAESDAVISLKDSTFDEFIAENDFVLVEFFAPWCGHCKQLAPEYEKAASSLLSKDPVVRLASVDATEEKDLSQRFEVSGYPTLKFFHNGEPEDYDGPRNADGIVEYCVKRSDPNYKPPPEAVVALNSLDELEAFTESAPLTLVEFYAPWCGHCKKLAPEYEKAAKDLLSQTPPIKLAKVDATANSELAKKYDVTGYPTLFMFRAKTSENGEVKVKSYPYDGPRQHGGIVEYLVKQSGDAARAVNSLKELKANMLVDDVIVVGMFSSSETAAYDLYQDSISIVRDKYAFLYTTSGEIRQKYGVANKEAVVVILPELLVTQHDKPFHVLTVEDDTENTAVLGFIDAHETPLIGTKSSSTKERFTKRPLCVLFVPVDWSHEYRQMTASWRDKLLPIANKYRKDFHFAMSDDEQNNQDVKSFGLDDSGSDFSFGCYGINGDKYPMEELDEWEEEEVEEFLDKVKAGAAKSFLRSQIAPKKQTKPVLTVTGSTFKDIVFDESKDVLIELYAPWCGHCKKFEPEYKKFAKKLANEKNLVIAKMNADANDGADGYGVMGYPTIYMAPAGKKDKPVKYEGNRDPEDLEKFVREHAEVSFRDVKDEL